MAPKGSSPDRRGARRVATLSPGARKGRRQGRGCIAGACIVSPFKGQQPSSGEPPKSRVAKEAEPDSDEEPEPRRSIDDIDRVASLCAIRDLFSRGEAREGLGREDALNALSMALGFGRLGQRIRDGLDNDIRTAVTRRILRNEGSMLLLETRSIEDYDREELKSQLLAAVGSAWTEREMAVRSAARRLGFARTGKRIRDAIASAVNGALRQGKLEAAGTAIRRRK